MALVESLEKEVSVKKVAIVGGTGYTGVELLRLLARHPEVEVCAITSRSEAGKAVSEIYPSLRGEYDLAFTQPTTQALAQADLVFFATPNGVAMKQAPDLLALGCKVIDLAADFRIQNVSVWSSWYGMEHACPELLDSAVYGLPEVNRNSIAGAQLVACPGCYPTATQLGFIPLLEQGLIDPSDLVANAASGASGAGRQANIDNLMSEVSDSFKAYAAAGHRHLPEIEQGLTDVSGGPVGLTFVPHLLPMIRGIHATLYANLKVDAIDLQALFEERYANEPFVDVLPAGIYPQTRTVKGSNVCRISVLRPQGKNKVVILSVIDNLVKGASGQAVQNMNIMFGFDECNSLSHAALLP